MCIPVVDPNCDPLADLAQGTAKRFLEELAAQASEAAADMLRLVVSGWLSLPSPDISQDSGPVALLRGYTNWAVAAIAIGAVLVAALRMAWDRNGQAAGSLARGLVTMVVITGAGVPAVRLLMEIGDSYSDWILDRSANGNLGERLLIFAPAGQAMSTMSPVMVIGIAFMLFITTAGQILVLLGQGAGLVLLAGAMPLAAAAGISESGRQLRDRYLTWILALLLYKPTAATIYAAAFWMLGEGQDVMTILTGLVMFAMALVALPALMRLLSPAISILPTGSAGSAGIGAAAGSATAQLASGAVRMATSSGGRAPSGRGASPSAAPVGASPPAPASGKAAASSAAPGAAQATTGSTAAAGTAAKAGASTAAGAGTAASAAGPVGAAVAVGAAAAQAGPAAVRKVGGTAQGAVEGGDK